MKKNILTENMRRFRTKNLSLNESTLSDDDILDIIMTYTKDPNAAVDALKKYRSSGDFGDASIEFNVTRDPRWTENEKYGINDPRSLDELEKAIVKQMTVKERGDGNIKVGNEINILYSIYKNKGGKKTKKTLEAIAKM